MACHLIAQIESIMLYSFQTARELATEANNEQKWKQLAELATSKSQFELAQECLHKANDYGGLLLLATSSGNKTCTGNFRVPIFIYITVAKSCGMLLIDYISISRRY